MVRYDVLGFADENSYLDHFFTTLLKTNWTYDYFVGWKKVRQNTRKYIREIGILNHLFKVLPEERKEELRRILVKHPETVRVIPLLIATRDRTVPILQPGEKLFYRVFDFSLRGISLEEAENLANFCEKVGILSVFEEIDDLYAYLLGVEVGLDSNARKNRSGETFQHLLGILLKKKMGEMNLQIRTEDQSIQTARNKRADFVVYYDGKPRIAIECNFYSGTGSKPIETANSYIDLQRKIRSNRSFSFIWVTDGQAWSKMSKTVIQCFKEIDFPINYAIAEDRLEKIVCELLR